MMKKGILLVYLLLMSFLVISQDINKNEVEKVAYNILNVKSKVKTIKSNIKLKSILKNDTILYYIANNGSDFVIIANDLRVNPILGYSDEGSYDAKNMPPQLLDLLESYKEEIIAVKRNEFNDLKSYNDDWQNYLKGNLKETKTSVSPIIKVEWNQGSGWNRFCPEDVDGPGGHVYAGCVAVSMAQSMSVYEHPAKGVGESSYYAGVYGLLSVNYGDTEYNWDLMSSSSSDDYNSLLLYHCAVALEMGFSPDGSGAYTRDIASSLKNHFDYSSSVYFKSSTEDQAWIDLLKSELDVGRPISYGGSNGVDVGHAFNLDGYNSSDAFHLNWGWSGSYNGYYQITALTPNGSDFSKGATAVLNIMPKDHNSTDIILSKTQFIDTIPINSVVSVITTEDPDDDDTFVYDVVGGEGIFGSTYCPFYIDLDSLKLKESVNYDEYNQLRIIITSEDSQGNIIEKSFKIDVLKDNYAPTNISLNNTLFDDTISIGTMIGVFNTIDQDEVDSFSYAFEVNENSDIGKDNGKFSLLNDTLVSNFDFSNYDKTQCSIFVKSADKRNEIVTKEFLIDINKTTGILNFDSEQEVKVYPNPSSTGLFYISLDSTKDKYLGNMYSLNVYNMQGIEVISLIGNLSKEVSFQLNKKGLYIIQFEIADKIISKKIFYE